RVKTLYFLIVSAVLPLLNLSFILNLEIFSRYSHYLNSIFNVELSFFHYIKFYVILGVIGVFVWYVKKIKNNTIEQMILNGLVFNMLLYGLSFQFALFLRVSYYFKIFEAVFLVYYHKRLYQFSSTVVRNVCMLLFIGIYSGLAVTDPFLVTDYQYRPLQIHENRS